MVGFRIWLSLWIAISLLIPQLFSAIPAKSIPATSTPAGLVAYIRDSNIWVIGADGANPFQVTTEGTYREVSWSPDSKMIAFSRTTLDTTTQKQVAEIGYFDVETQSIKIVVPPEQIGLGRFYGYGNPRWSPDSNTLYFSQDDLRIAGNFIHTINIHTLQRDVGFSSFDTIGFDISPKDGHIVYRDFINGMVYSNNLNLANANGTGRYALFPFEDGVHIYGVAWKRDGSQFIFSAYGGSYGSGTVVIMSASGAVQQKWSATNAYTFCYSPDGNYVATSSTSSISILDPTTHSVSPLTTGINPSWGPSLPMDLSISQVAPVQVVEPEVLAPEYQYLVNGKSTAIKVIVHKEGVGPVGKVQVIISHDGNSFDHFYVADANSLGTITNPNRTLTNDQNSYPLGFGFGTQEKAIYFFDPEFTPNGGGYQVSATVNPGRTLAETNENNNTLESASFSTKSTGWGKTNLNLDIYYFPVDWPKSISQFDTAVSYHGRFLKGIFPVAENDFNPIPDHLIEYSGAGNKDWGPLDINLWLRRIQKKVSLSHPEADRYVAILPDHWFTDHTSLSGFGASNRILAPLMAMGEARVYSRPNDLPTVEHEIGHTYGLPYFTPLQILGMCGEEYTSGCASSGVDGIGNYSAAGIFVDAKIPVINVPADRKTFCMMSGINTSRFENWETWIDAADYAEILQSSDVSTYQIASQLPTKGILISGIASDNGTITLDDWYQVDDPEFHTLASGQYAVEFRDAANTLIQSVSFDLPFDDQGIHYSELPFSFILPLIDGTASVGITRNGSILAQRFVSAHSPMVTISSPAAGQVFQSSLTIRWAGSDPDGDALTYSILVSADGGANWDTLLMDVKETNLTWEIPSLPAGNQYQIKVIATDGFNTGEAVSGNITLLEKQFLPMVKR